MTNKRLTSSIILGVLILFLYAWWHTDDRASVAAPPERAAKDADPGSRAEPVSYTGGIDETPALPDRAARAGLTRGKSDPGEEEHAAARIALQQRNWEGAREWLEKAVTAAPERAQSWSDLAYACLGQGGAADLERGMAAATRANELDPSLWEALYNRACLHARLGQVDSALTDLELAVTQSPEKARTAARTDTDLDGLRASPRFIKLVASD